MFDEYNDEYEELEYDPGSEDHISTAVLEQRPLPRICPQCQRTDNVSIYKSRHKVLLHDVWHDRPCLIAVLRNRYRCSRCRKTFLLGRPLPEKMDDRFAAEIFRALMNDHSATNTKIGSKFGLSPSTVSKIFTGLAKEKTASIETFVESSVLFLCPVTYQRQTRCIVIGGTLDDKRLLGILDSYSIENALSYCRNRIDNPRSIEVTFSAANPQMLKSLKTQYPYSVQCILLSYREWLIDHLSVDLMDGLYSRKLDALHDFMKMMSESNSNNFHTHYTRWLRSLDTDIRQELSKLVDVVKDTMPAWEASCDYAREEADCHELLIIIKRFDSNNVPFDHMRFRMMFMSSNNYAIDRGSYCYIGGYDFVYTYDLLRYGVPICDILAYYNMPEKQKNKK